MAYTIISQNNNTTTLSDGVNTITVPSRVNLTSGNFTIVEVNNNMATLEDGDGNVYRDIPCVATLAGEGGGGGSGLPDQTGHSGEFLTTDGTDASWAAVNALPDQTGQSGKFLTTDGSSASWSDKPLVNKATGMNSIAVGSGSTAQATGIGGCAFGRSSRANNNYSVSIGYAARSGADNTIQLCATLSVITNSDANTFKVANANGNFMIMDANGNLPADRLASTTGLADGNYRLRLTMASGVPTLSWVAE